MSSLILVLIYPHVVNLNNFRITPKAMGLYIQPYKQDIRHPYKYSYRKQLASMQQIRSMDFDKEGEQQFVN